VEIGLARPQLRAGGGAALLDPMACFDGEIVEHPAGLADGISGLRLIDDVGKLLVCPASVLTRSS
jgi:hypothetical protein